MPDPKTGLSAVPYDPSQDGWQIHPAGAFITLVGPIWSKQANGVASFGLLAEPKHGNHRGIVHGGMIMTLADYTIGMAAALSAGDVSVTIQLDVQFVSAAEIGDFIVSRHELVRKTSSLFFLRGDLSVDGRIVATASGIWKAAKPLASPHSSQS
jgi:uncharacterized protein (TIGR00369 family)